MIKIRAKSRIVMRLLLQEGEEACLPDRYFEAIKKSEDKYELLDGEEA